MPAANLTPSVMFVPTDSLAEDEIPSMIQVAGRFVHAPILDGDRLLVDTGCNVLDLRPGEIPVLRTLLVALDTQSLASSG